jgi:hypothetical protein
LFKLKNCSYFEKKSNLEIVQILYFEKCSDLKKCSEFENIKKKCSKKSSNFIFVHIQKVHTSKVLDFCKCSDFFKNSNLKVFKKEAEKRKSKIKRKKEIMKYLMGRGPVWPLVHAGCAAPAPLAANGRHKGAPLQSGASGRGPGRIPGRPPLSFFFSFVVCLDGLLN